MANIQRYLAPRARRNATACNLSTLAGNVDGFVFELRDVLYDESAWRRWLFQLLSRMGLHAEFDVLFRTFDRDFYSEVAERGYWSSLRSFLRSAGMSKGHVDEVEAAGRPRLRQYEQGLRLFPGTRSVLQSLSGAGYPLGLAVGTTISPIPLEQRIERLGLADQFAQVHVADLTNESIRFEEIASAMHLPLARVAYVGNDSRALSLSSVTGIATIAFNADPAAEADFSVEQLAELQTFADTAGQDEPPSVRAAA